MLTSRQAERFHRSDRLLVLLNPGRWAWEH